MTQEGILKHMGGHEKKGYAHIVYLNCDYLLTGLQESWQQWTSEGDKSKPLD